jgi:hypothetical protein
LDTLEREQSTFPHLDLALGGNQIALAETDLPKMAFIAHIGKYEWKVMPMG